jgi:hypothetical protein
MLGDRLKILRNATDGEMIKKVGGDLSKVVVKGEKKGAKKSPKGAKGNVIAIHASLSPCNNGKSYRPPMRDRAI